LVSIRASPLDFDTPSATQSKPQPKRKTCGKFCEKNFLAQELYQTLRCRYLTYIKYVGKLDTAPNRAKPCGYWDESHFFSTPKKQVSGNLTILGYFSGILKGWRVFLVGKLDTLHFFDFRKPSVCEGFRDSLREMSNVGMNLALYNSEKYMHHDSIASSNSKK